MPLEPPAYTSGREPEARARPRAEKEGESVETREELGRGGGDGRYLTGRCVPEHGYGARISPASDGHRAWGLIEGGDNSGSGAGIGVGERKGHHM